MSESLVRQDLGLDSLVGRVADEFLRRQEAGDQPDVDEYAARHPEAADLLRKVLTSLCLIDRSMSGIPGAETDLGTVTGLLGDFRLLREVGRGGMGVVYEAAQISLGRRVALKVLPFAATMDSRHLQRFQNEARSAASLEHPHIVPVYGVGCERGVHYYAMKFIDGQTVAALIAGQRQDPQEKEPTQTYTAQTPAADTRPHAQDATAPAPRDAAYFRRAAEWGIQAAEALEHAHSLGIVHRDIKPANLMIDAQGKLWVTDFGLARTAADTGLTMTGDVLGTLRYMSPEQAQASHGLVDHRTDVYSLGVTLYELLTLRPAIEGEDRARLLQKICLEEPVGPRRIDKAIPSELETIVLQAIEKEPGRRYRTAAEMAEDLSRWLGKEPIKARRPSVRQVVPKWMRRHRPVVWSAAIALLVSLAAIAANVGWVVRDRAAGQAKIAADVRAALHDAQRAQKDGKFAQARAAAKRAEDLVKDAPAEPALAEQVQELLRDLAEEEADDRLVARLEELRLLQAEVNGDSFVLERALPDYREAFETYGLRAIAVTAEDAAAFLRRRPNTVHRTLMAALDHWLILARYKKAPEADWLERVLALADSDAWRQRLRSARQRNDRQAMEQLAREVEAAAQPPEELFLLHLGLRQRGAKEGAVALLQRAQDAFPSDFWINHDLGMALHQCRPPRNEEAIRFLTAAVALRPESPGARLNLGAALLEQGRFDEAVLAFRKAIERKRDYAVAHNNLGIALARNGQLEEAVASFGRAVELRPNYAEACCNLGCALRQQGAFNEALAAFERGNDLGSRLPNWRYPSAEWMSECQRLIELDRRLPDVIKGEVQPLDAAERCDYARLCFFKRRYLAAARFWADAFEADPSLARDRTGGQRYDAACAAALVGADQGVNAGEVADIERARWRQQAIKWLRADLTACRALLESGRPEDRRMAQQELQRWQRDPNLAGLRDPSAVATLRADEQEECKHLWVEVDALINTSDLSK